jgi:hypothetical protein
MLELYSEEFFGVHAHCQHFIDAVAAFASNGKEQGQQGLSCAGGSMERKRCGDLLLKLHIPHIH